MKILAVRNDRFGEFLLTIPALRALKKSHPEARFILAVSPYVQGLAGMIGFVDEIIPWENKRHRFIELLKFSRLLKAKRIDLCVVFNPSKEFNIISFLSGIPKRVGYDRKWGFLLTHKLPDRKYLGERHEVDYNMELASLTGAKTQDKSLSLDIDNGIINNLLKSYNIKDTDILVALHPYTSDPIKQWPEERFVELADRLLQIPDIKVIIIGGKEELSRAQELYSRQNSLINLTGRTSLKELALLLSICRLLISGDSGPVHLASCVGTRVLALFRNDIPGKTAKRWGPWGKGHAVIEKDSLFDITVDEVLAKVKEITT